MEKLQDKATINRLILLFTITYFHRKSLCFLWNKYSIDVPPAKAKTIEKKNSSATKMIFTPVMICVMLVIILQGMLKDGVTTWMPTYISETFNLSSAVSTVSGVINSCTYIGSAISTYGIALVSEKFGWSVTLLMWTVIAVTATVICFANIVPWKKKFQSDED